MGSKESDIRREAVSLLLHTEHSERGDYRVFPELPFTCRGSIESVVFVAETCSTGDTGTTATSIGIWEPVRHSRTRFTGRLHKSGVMSLSNIETVSGQGNMKICRASFQTPLHFYEGDVLGIGQDSEFPGVSMQYAYSWGPENYILNSSRGAISHFLTGPALSNDFPLLALESYTCQCEWYSR